LHPSHAAGAPGGTVGRLLRFAVANIVRRPERFLLTTLGIALAVMAVVVVRTIAISYSDSGSAALQDVLRGAPLWVVGGDGFHYDSRAQSLVPDGPVPEVALPVAWTSVVTVAGTWTSPVGEMLLYGRDDVDVATVQLSPTLAAELDLASGDSFDLAGSSLTVGILGSGRSATLARSIAEPLVGSNGWLTVTPSQADAARQDLGALLEQSSGLDSTTDPSSRASDAGLIFDTVGSTAGALTFAQRFAAVFGGQVTTSTLGMVSTVGLVLGFVIAVSSFLAAVQERRREFGIMSSIGLADEVLYFFLVESALVFVVAYLVGSLLAGAAVTLVVPGLASFGGWVRAAAMVAAYLPAMAIVGALIPVHRLLQQRPVELLAEAR
jgi:ABC-type antimicrobial peptide transport system permease subunit